MSNEIITILITASSLGGYIPGLILSRKLEEKGVLCEINILENLYIKEKRDKIIQTKIAFHKNFSVALLAQKLLKKIESNLDTILVHKLIDKWSSEKRKRFIVFSGFWSPLISEYTRTVNQDELSFDLCHIDASISTSWKAFEEGNFNFKHIWFYNQEKNDVLYYIPVDNKAECISFNQRNKRLLLHGGGWGLGTYLDKVEELEKEGFSLDIICIEKEDAGYLSENIKYYLIDPQWKAWEKNQQGKYIFPPFAEINGHKNIVFKSNYHYPDVYEICKQNMAIISKPGGATLIDSLSSATPIIMLEPYGDYEKANSLLWEKKGFGMSFDKWAEKSFSIDVLRKMHLNILQSRSKIKNYITEIYAT